MTKLKDKSFYMDGVMKQDGCLVEHLCRPRMLCQNNKKVNRKCQN